MTDVRAFITGARPDGHRRQQNVSGFVSLQKSAPGSFTDTLWVVLPSHSSEISIPFAKWPRSQGTNLPTAGDSVLVGYDEDGAPHVLGFGI